MGATYPSEKWWSEFVSWGYFSQYMEKSKMLQTTNQNKSQNLPGGASKFVTRSNSLDPNQKRLETRAARAQKTSRQHLKRQRKLDVMSRPLRFLCWIWIGFASTKLCVLGGSRYGNIYLQKPQIYLVINQQISNSDTALAHWAPPCFNR